MSYNNILYFLAVILTLSAAPLPEQPWLPLFARLAARSSSSTSAGASSSSLVRRRGSLRLCDY